MVTDRFVDSSVAYQGAGRDLDADEVGPALELGHRRAGAGPDRRAGPVRRGGAPAAAAASPDRLESEPDDFHERVRERFLDLARLEPRRYLVVNAASAPEHVQDQVRLRLAAMLPESEQQRADRERREQEQAALIEAQQRADAERRAREAQAQAEQAAAQAAAQAAEQAALIEAQARQAQEHARAQAEERARLAQEQAQRKAEEQAAAAAARLAQDEARAQVALDHADRARSAETPVLATGPAGYPAAVDVEPVPMPVLLPGTRPAQRPGSSPSYGPMPVRPSRWPRRSSPSARPSVSRATPTSRAGAAPMTADRTATGRRPADGVWTDVVGQDRVVDVLRSAVALAAGAGWC